MSKDETPDKIVYQSLMIFFGGFKPVVGVNVRISVNQLVVCWAQNDKIVFTIDILNGRIKSGSAWTDC